MHLKATPTSCDAIREKNSNSNTQFYFSFLQVAIYKKFSSPFFKVLGIALTVFLSLKYTRIALVQEVDGKKEAETVEKKS